MQIVRGRERTKVDIPISVMTVLDRLEGIIVDISEEGARIAGCTLPPASQCQIDFQGHIVYATVQWSEPDRMGVRFPYALTDGPLFDMLELARGCHTLPACQTGGRTPGAMPPSAGGFGRRVG